MYEQSVHMLNVMDGAQIAHRCVPTEIERLIGRYDFAGGRDVFPRKLTRGLDEIYAVLPAIDLFRQSFFLKKRSKKKWSYLGTDMFVEAQP